MIFKYWIMTERLRLDEFRANILTAMLKKPKEWRDGQFVFNYINEVYGVARYVQFSETDIRTDICENGGRGENDSRGNNVFPQRQGQSAFAG
jgi:hypothetical protein